MQSEEQDKEYDEYPCQLYRKMPIDKFIDVPLCRQATSYTCGVAALQSVFRYYCIDYRQDLLAAKLESTYEAGTDHRKIIDLAQSMGFQTEFVTNMNISLLKSLINQNIPVILMIQAYGGEGVDYSTEYEDGHYVVACGYSKHHMYFMDPSTLGNYTYIPISNLLERWHDYDDYDRYEHAGIIITKRDESCHYNPKIIKYLA